MGEKAPQTALVPPQTDLQTVLKGAISLRASATTSESESRADLLRGNQRIVLSFFRHTEKLPSEVELADVQGWLRDLEEKGIGAGTTYQHLGSVAKIALRQRRRRLCSTPAPKGSAPSATRSGGWAAVLASVWPPGTLPTALKNRLSWLCFIVRGKFTVLWLRFDASIKIRSCRFVVCGA
jgi:hypothetical protein